MLTPPLHYITFYLVNHVHQKQTNFNIANSLEIKNGCGGRGSSRTKLSVAFVEVMKCTVLLGCRWNFYLRFFSFPANIKPILLILQNELKSKLWIFFYAVLSVVLVVLCFVVRATLFLSPLLGIRKFFLVHLSLDFPLKDEICFSIA